MAPSTNPAGGGGGRGILDILAPIASGALSAMPGGMAVMGQFARGYADTTARQAQMQFEGDMAQRKGLMMVASEMMKNPNLANEHQSILAQYLMDMANTPYKAGNKNLPKWEDYIKQAAAVKAPQLNPVPPPPTGVMGSSPQGALGQISAPAPPPGMVGALPQGAPLSGMNVASPVQMPAPPPAQQVGPAGQLHFSSPEEQMRAALVARQNAINEGLIPRGGDESFTLGPGQERYQGGKLIASNDEKKPSNRPDFEPELVSGSVVGVRDNKSNRLLSPEEAAKNPEAKKVLDMAQKGTQDAETRTESKESRAFNRALNMADIREQQRVRTEARKAVTGVETQYKQDDTRLNLMQKAQKEANAGNAQADMALISNHLGMTMGLQKGARITQTVWNEAMRTRPWLQSVKVTFVGGLLTGAKLSPEQREQMVDLAKDRVAESGRSVNESYQQYGEHLKGHQRIVPKTMEGGGGAGAPRPAYQLNGVWYDGLSGQPIQQR